jgi:hypothetical protein
VIGAAVVVLPGAGLVGLDFWSIATGDTVLYDRAGTGWSDAVPPGRWILIGSDTRSGRSMRAGSPSSSRATCARCC